jgi:hypothetical protein
MGIPAPVIRFYRMNPKQQVTENLSGHIVKDGTSP